MTPTLTTERLRLRAPHINDLSNIYKLGSDPEVMRYISYGRTQSRREAKKDLDKRIQLSQGPFGYWITEELATGDFIGWMALKKLDRSNDVEIGYRFLKEKWGNGFATEASKKVLSYGFETLQLEQVMAVTMPANKASRRVLEKIGLQYQGTGTFYNTHCVVYRINQEQFIALLP